MMQTTRPQFTAFTGQQRLVTGPLAEVALAVMTASRKAASAPVVIFDDATGRPIDLDLRGTERDIVARLPQPDSNPQAPDDQAPEPRGRGRPKLGVVAREVTLLPRHWEWLAAQPGGASAALRRLVDQGRRENTGEQERRQIQDAAYRVATTLVGDRPGYEEAMRALFAGDLDRFHQQATAWPPDIAAYLRDLTAPL